MHDPEENKISQNTHQKKKHDSTNEDNALIRSIEKLKEDNLSLVNQVKTLKHDKAKLSSEYHQILKQKGNV